MKTFSKLLLIFLLAQSYSFGQQISLPSGQITIGGNITLGAGLPILTLTLSAFSPLPGTYSSTQNVALSSPNSPTPTICWNLDTPPMTDGAGTCTVGTTYSGPVAISATHTLYAIATETGFHDSSTINGLYTINSACAPPGYSCATTTTAVVQMPPPLFSISDAANTQKTELVLSQLNWTRLTDRATAANTPCGQGNSWGASASGGANEVPSNVTTTLIALRCFGGVTFVFGYNPTTMTIYPAGNYPAASGTCAGASAFSRKNDNLFYCRPRALVTTPIGVANGNTIYKITYPNAAGTNLCGLGVGLCPDPSATPTWSILVDLGTCPAAPAGNATSGSLLGVGANDSEIDTALSWTGGQDTAHFWFAYLPGTGCTTIDTLGNGTNMAWYPAGSSTPTFLTSLNAVTLIHEVYTNGTYDVMTIGDTSCVGTDCGAPFIWQVNTSNIYTTKAVGNSGHHSISASYWINGTDPTHKHLLGTPASNINIADLADINHAPLPAASTFDSHQDADVQSDANPLIGASYYPTNNFPCSATRTGPYQSELFGGTTDVNPPNTTIFRFGETYSSSNQANFSAGQAVSTVSQDRCTLFVTSDMCGTLGTRGGSNISDVFAVGICGQPGNAHVAFDNFGGLVTYSTGVAGPTGSGVANAQSATFTRASSTITATVTDGTKYKIHEPMKIAGTGTALDWQPCSGSDTTGAGCASVITAISGNTVTLTSPSSGTITSHAGTIAPAHGYFEKQSTGWRWFDPEDNWLFWQMIGAACAGQGGVNCAMSGATFTAKYGSTCAGAAAELSQWMGVGLGGFFFNGLGDDSESAYDPTSNGACPSNTRYVEKGEQFLTDYASANLTGGTWTPGLDQPIKNLNFAVDANYPCGLRRAQLDYFDARWLTFLEGFPPAFNASINNYYASPFHAGLEVDDTKDVMFADSGPDFHTLPSGHNDCDGALLVAETSPLQTYNGSPIYGSTPAYLYPDAKVYSKTLSAIAPSTCSITTPCSWPDLLRKRYGTIGALNTAWSTSGHYTTFGSSATAVTAESLGTGDGSTATFSKTLANANVAPFSVQILASSAQIAGDCPAFADCPNDGAGKGRIASVPASTLTAASVITYSTGVISVTFAGGHIPANGVAITVNYSSAGWKSGGTGVADEDGSSAWFGSNAICLKAKANWAAATPYVVGDIVRDPTSHSWQYATTAGTSSGSSPLFSVTTGTITNDNGIHWESEGHPVCGSDAGSDYPAANANATVAQDLADFLAQFSAADFSAIKTAFNLNYPDWPILGLDQLGVAFAPPRKEVLQAAAQYFDAAFTELVPPPLDLNGDAKFKFFTEYFPGPMVLYQNLASSQGQTGCSGLVDPGCQPTQAARGSAWSQEVTYCLTQLGYDGKTHCTGIQWWGSHTFQGVGWGFNTNLDNPYDGVSDVPGVISCPAPLAAYHCGGEAAAGWNSTNAVQGSGKISDGNSLWWAHP